MQHFIVWTKSIYCYFCSYPTIGGETNLRHDNRDQRNRGFSPEIFSMAGDAQQPILIAFQSAKICLSKALFCQKDFPYKCDFQVRSATRFGAKFLGSFFQDFCPKLPKKVVLYDSCFMQNCTFPS